MHTKLNEFGERWRRDDDLPCGYNSVPKCKQKRKGEKKGVNVHVQM